MSRICAYSLTILGLLALIAACGSPKDPYELGSTEELLSITEKHLRAISRSVQQAKILDSESGQVREVFVDKHSGVPVDWMELREANHTAWRETHGALTEPLAEYLAGLAPAASLTTHIWVQAPAGPPFKTSAEIPADWDAAHSQFMAERIAQNRANVTNTRDRLEASEADIQAVEFEPPRITVRATRETIESKLAFLPLVAAITRDDSDQPLLAVQAAADLGQASLGLAHVLGAGHGLRIALVETSACIHSRHSHFQLLTFEDSLGIDGRCDADQNSATLHATNVAGSLAGAKGTPGNFELIGLFAGRLFESAGASVNQFLLSRNPHFVNRSQLITAGSQNEMDYAVYMHRIFIANGSGNDSQKTVACYSFNSLCVGGYAHQGTIGDFSDDTYSGASFLNDPATGREEPDVAGTYSQLMPVLGFNDFYGRAGGTSYATPSVLGLGALLTASFPKDLLGDPTLLRAVLMASARAVSDVPDDNTPVPLVNDGVDDRTGAGAPRGDVAKDILEGEDFLSELFDRQTAFSAQGSLLNPPRVVASPGQTVRVAIVWDQCADPMSANPDLLLVDLDLVVSGPAPAGESLLFSNVSAVDNYELVEFVAPRQGSYVFNIKAQSWGPCAVDTNQERTHIAVAWAKA